MKPRIYNRNMELVGILRNASSIGYTHSHNNLYTASFELPAPDPQNEICDTHYIVDIYDGDASSGKYRILDEPESDITSNGSFLKYSCEHVIAFLLNDVINGHLEAGGTGKNTRYVIEQLLAMQSVQRWQLGQCDFAYAFQYSWENTNLLDALFSIPKCFEDQYHWTYDTSSYPWTLNLVAQSTDRSCEVRKKRNMQFIKRGKDSSALCTRLYCKGSGEGVNQLGIADVNPTGMPYIDADTIGTYGILSSHFIDLTVNDAVSLYAKGRAILREVKHPRYTYSAKAADLSKITGLEWDKFDEGKYVRLYDEEKGLDLDAMIVEVSKRDIEGDPLDVDIVISNKPSDVASAIEDLSKRAAIHAQYSQGATNLYSQQYADNADIAHPAVMRFYIPNGAVRINQVLLSWRFSAFRAYETGAASGGGSTETSSTGGGAEKTSSSGGGVSKSVDQNVGNTGEMTSPTNTRSASVSNTGDMTAPTNTHGSSVGNTGEMTAVTDTHGPNSNSTGAPSSDSTGPSTELSTASGGNYKTSAATGGTDGSSATDTQAAGDEYTGYGGTGSTGTGTAHTHTITNHRHSYTMGASDTGYTQPGATNEGSHTHSGPSHRHTGPSHTHAMGHTHGLGSHTHTAPNHTHGMAHTHNLNQHTHSLGAHTHQMGAHWHSMVHTHQMGAHWHNMEHVHEMGVHWHNMTHTHTFSVPNHTHTLDIPDHSHTVAIPSHTHEIIHGIFEGTSASAATIKVDGTTVPSGSVSADEMDIVAWLAKDANGKITRGTWHTVEIIPDTLTRIESNLFIQTFVTSYEGGNY